MVFFLDAEDRVYARYGGRDAKNAEHRQSLPGLRYTMESVLAVHAREKKDAERDFAPKSQDKPKYLRDMAGVRGGRGCMHCHQVKEVLERDLRRTGKWERDMIFRYPLPENVGFALEVDRGNVVKKIADKTPAADIGLRSGDIILGFDGKRPEMNAETFLRWVQNTYLVGDQVTINVLRDGQPMSFRMKLQP